MDFDPAEFNVLKEGKQEEIDSLREHIEELNKNENFIFVLFESLFSEAAGDIFIKREILFIVKNIIAEKWTVFSDEQKKLIIENLFQFITMLPDEITMYISYILQIPIKVNDFNITLIIPMLIESINLECKTSSILTYASIAKFWFKYLSFTKRVVSRSEDVFICQLVEKFLEILDGYSFDESDPFRPQIIKMIMSCFKCFLKISLIGIEGDLAMNVLQHALAWLEKGDDSILGIISLLSSSISHFYSSTISLTCYNGNENYNRYQEVFKTQVMPQVLPFIKELESTEICKEIAFIKYQIVFYGIDESFEWNSFLEYLLNITLLDEESINDIIEQPMVYIADKMRLDFTTDPSPRQLAAKMIRICINRYPDDIESVIQFLSTESETYVIDEAKLFLLTAIAKSRSDIFTEEFASSCQEIVGDEQKPAFLRLTALFLYSKIINNIDAGSGIGLALAIFSEESFVVSAPIFCIYAAKSFNSCANAFSSEIEFDLEKVLEAFTILNSNVSLISRSITNMKLSIASFYPQEFHELLESDIVNLLDNVIDLVQKDSIEADKYSEEVKSLINTETASEELLQVIFQKCYSILELESDNFFYKNIYEICSMFSLKTEAHTAMMYEFVIQVCQFVLSNEVLKKDAAVFSTEDFVNFVYPFVVENNPECSEQIEELCRNICLEFYQIALQNLGITSTSVAYILFLMNVYIQTFGIFDVFVDCAIEQLKQQMEDESETLIIDAAFRILSSCSVINSGSVAEHLLTEENSSIIDYLLTINCSVIGTFNGMCSIEILALNLSDHANQVFPFAANNMENISFLLNTSDAQEGGDEEEESLEEEEYDDWDYEPDGIIVSYPLRMDSINIFQFFREFIERREDLFNELPEEMKAKLLEMCTPSN